MSSIAHVSQAMKLILQERAKELERSTGFVSRSTAQVDGPVFAQTLVFGLLDTPQASYSQLRHVAASLGVEVSRQAVQQRFGQASVALMRQLLEEAVGQVLTSEGREGAVPELLSRFGGVYLQDGTRIGLPETMAQQWPGFHRQVSGMQVQGCIDYAHGAWQGLWVAPGSQNEQIGPGILTPLPPGSLLIVDGGYLNLPRMRQWEQEGRYWIMPPRSDLVCFDERGVCCSLTELLGRHQEDLVDLPIQVGKKERVPVRLVARRLSAEAAQRRQERSQHRSSSPAKGAQRPNQKKQPARTRTGKRDKRGHRHQRRTQVSQRARALQGWRIVLSNVPVDRLHPEEVLVLARCRWQIELIWKWGKQLVKVDTWRSEQPERILTEIFAKWLAMLLTQWIVLIEGWLDPRHSMVKAFQAVQWMTPVLALGLCGVVSLETALECSSHVLRRGCQVAPRRKRPATFQLVASPPLILA